MKIGLYIYVFQEISTLCLQDHVHVSRDLSILANDEVETMIHVDTYFI